MCKNETFYYNGYYGSIEYNESDYYCYHGKFLFIPDVVNYMATSKDNLELEFKYAVDDYINILMEEDYIK